MQSADLASSDTSLTPGQALQTVIIGPSGVSGQSVAVNGTNLFSLPNLTTELRGFTIMTPVERQHRSRRRWVCR